MTRQQARGEVGKSGRMTAGKFVRNSSGKSGRIAARKSVRNPAGKSVRNPTSGGSTARSATTPARDGVVYNRFGQKMTSREIDTLTRALKRARERGYDVQSL